MRLFENLFPDKNGNRRNPRHSLTPPDKKPERPVTKRMPKLVVRRVVRRMPDSTRVFVPALLGPGYSTVESAPPVVRSGTAMKRLLPPDGDENDSSPDACRLRFMTSPFCVTNADGTERSQQHPTSALVCAVDPLFIPFLAQCVPPDDPARDGLCMLDGFDMGDAREIATALGMAVCCVTSVWCEDDNTGNVYFAAHVRRKKNNIAWK